MKIVKLDRDDRQALAQLGTYCVLALCVLVLLLLLALTLGLCVHLFHWAGG